MNNSFDKIQFSPSPSMASWRGPPFITCLRAPTLPRPLKALTESHPVKARSPGMQVSSPRDWPTLLMSMWRSLFFPQRMYILPLIWRGSAADVYIATYLTEHCKAKNKYFCVLRHNYHGFIVSRSVLSMKQHACVSLFLGRSTIINSLRVIFSDLKTLILTGNEQYFAAELLWIRMILPCLAQKIDEGSFTRWTSQQPPPLLYLLAGKIWPWIKPVASPLPSRSVVLIDFSLWIDCLFEIRKIAVCFLWLSLPGHYRVTDEALLAETT